MQLAMAVNSLYLVGVVLMAECLTVAWSAVGCLDNNGDPVDWFIVYKMPKLVKNKNELIKEGVGQMYMDVNSQRWSLLDVPVTGKDHAIYRTLQQIYGNHRNQDIAYVLYNDETPAGKQRLNHGHTKGDMCFDSSSGFWLVHSVPKFPPDVSEGYSYPSSGTVFGQTFLCVTYSYQQFNVIGQQLLYTYPQVYSSQLPTAMATDNVNVGKVLQGLRVEAAPWNNSVSLPSLGDQQFISFAKFTKFGRDLYDAWVAPYFASELQVETWLNGGKKLPSNCSTQYHVLNIKTLNVSGVSFTDSHDHAKWAVTTSGDWICIGDINREPSQFHRAGGTVCSSLPTVATAFRESIVTTEKCQDELIRNKQLKFSVNRAANFEAPRHHL